MRKNKMKRIGAALLAAVMTLQCAGGFLTAKAADTNTQMSSDKEVVYVNSYNSTEREQNFDENWKFYLGEASGAEQQTFDDSTWRNVSLPHDYSIEQEYSSSMEAESGYLPGGTGWYRKHFVVGRELEGKELRIDFGGVYMNATVWVNGTQLGTHPYGYTPFSFDITDYVNVGEENVITVKVDHKTPSSRWYSGSGIYRSVNLTVTDKVHVDLYGTKIESLNLETEKGGTVNSTVKTTVANAGTEAAEVVLVHTIYEKGTETSIGTVTTDATSVAAGESKDITATLPAANPALWGVDSPNLYTVKTEVKVGGTVVDTYETEYGFRYYSFDNNTGFTLNGEKLKLKGVCMHHDQGSLGAEAHYAAVKRQMQIMKDMGCNAIRVTHNPASDELLQACNEIGLLVIEEAFDGWSKAKNGNNNDYSAWFEVAIASDNEIIGAESGMTWAEFDIKAMVNRGKNEPSIIMWSLGNEITEGTNSDTQPTYPQIALNLIQWVEEVDTTRPVTNGDNKLQALSYQTMLSVDANIHAAGGVVGINYGNDTEYDNIHKRYPDWLLYGAETASHVNSRGEYGHIGSQELNSDKALTAYDYSKVGWGATASEGWYDVITRDYIAGEFVWTGFDYIGEPTPRNGVYGGAQGAWPSPKNSFFGIVDTAGLPKDNYYFYQSQWNDDVNTLHVLPAWNSDVVYKGNSNGVPVVVYSDAASVELFLTGTDGVRESLGKKTFTEKTTAAGYKYQIYEGAGKDGTTNRNLYLTWYVPYEDGMIEAVAYDKDNNVISNTVGRSMVKTTGDEAKLDAAVDRQTISADGKDLAYITVDVKDADGNIVPDAANNVRFTVTGDGVLVGVDNGKQADHQSFQDDNRNAYNGSLVAIVQSTKNAGSFTVTATSNGLESDSVTVTTTAVEGAETGKQMTGFYMSKNYYVKVGNMPVLPTTIETRYSDGTSEELAVVWDTIAPEKIAEAGVFGVNGMVDDLYSVSVTINMIDELGGLLNYSTTTSKGVAPVLPQTRPAVAVDGEILNVAFPVEWAEITADQYAEAGTFVVTGTADVLGQEMTVTASVRVQEETLTLGDNIAPSALRLTEDIPDNLTSDTLSAIKDGSIVKDANSDGGRNTSAWSNYNAAQADDTTAEITFEYATQQRIGQITIHFWKDGYSAEFPDAGTTEIYVSGTGEDGTWTKLDVNETIGTETDSVKPYTYDFTPVLATFVKIGVTNSTAQKNAKPCTGIVEVAINLMDGTFNTYTTAEFDSIKVNDATLTAEEIAEGVYYTLDETATVEATGKDNAAVTVLPAHNDKVRLIVESEDHKLRDTFLIRLGEEAPFDPTDDSQDVPVSSLTAISSNQSPTTASEGPDDYILDGSEGTHWHTDWSGSKEWSANESNRWVGVELAEVTSVSGIRYLPRQGGNGDVTKYRVEYKATADGAWTAVPGATGNWSKDDDSWKYIEFEEEIAAAAVRIVGVETWTDAGNNRHMSTAEFRLVEGEGTVTPPPAGTVDKTALTAKISEAAALDEADYTAATWAALEAAVDAANAVKNDTDATQEEVNDAIAAITAAIEALEDAETPGITLIPGENYPVEHINVSAGSTQGDSIGLATDGDTDTYWETRWATQTSDNNAGKLWFQLELEEAAEIDQLSYYPRYQGTNLNNGDQNGFISKYEVKVSQDGEAWETVATGNWSPVDNWLTADFDAVEAKYVRLVGVETLNNGNATTTDMSIAEIRVRVAEEGETPEQPCTHANKETLPAVEATCEATGLTAGEKCIDCGETTTAQTVVPKKAHTPETIPAVEATCTKTGLTAGSKCSVCDHEITAQTVVPMKAHTPETIPAVAATCTETGLTEGTKCSVCQKVTVAQEEVAALGHDYPEQWTVVKEATTEAEGLEERQCTRCDAKEERPIAKLDKPVDPDQPENPDKPVDPDQPTDLVITPEKPANNSVALTWSKVEGAEKYNVVVNGKVVATITAEEALAYTVEDLKAGEENIITVEAVDADGKTIETAEIKVDLKEEEPTNKPGSPVTGDTAPVFVWFMAAVVMAAVAFFAKKRTR